jgi:nucleoside-diphosphate-sugar epimerase
MIINTICILGGTGFVGRTLANRLSQKGFKLRILTRNREYHKEELILLPTVDLVEADIHRPEVLKKQFAGCDAVINLVGILNEKGRHGEGFRHVHVELAEKVVDGCIENRVKRLLHMSALHADPVKGTSYYLKTKGEAENLIHESSKRGLRVTSFRPSVIFGPDDSFFNRFAKLLKMTPMVFPLACPGSRFAPIYVGDVAEAFVKTIADPSSYGKRYNLCGPEVYTLQELVAYTAACLGISRKIIPLGDLISRIQAAMFDFVPGKPFSTDNYLSAKIDSICHRNDLHELDITPSTIQSIVPQYLSNKYQRARYYQFRSHLSGK